MTEEPAPPPRRYVRRPKSPLGWIVLALVLLVGVVAIGGLVVRYGVLLPQTRLLIEARANGVKLGRVGRLRVEGLGGDIWRNFTVRKLTIADEKGVWLQADQVAVKWSYLALLQRRLSVDEATAAKVSVFRRPSLTPKTKSKGLPVSTVIDKATFRLETYPAFSVKRGLFDVAAALQLERNGGQVGQASAVSLLHTGDRLDVKFDISKLRPLLIDAKAFEAQGGALAGTLGLPAERPFRAVALARGNQNGGSLVLNAWSGAAQPVVAGGNWTKEGGLIRGRIDMAASTLLTPYVKMFGRELTFSAAGRKAADDYYGIGLRVGAENLWLKARGKADLFRRAAPNGLNIDLTVRDLSRVVDWKFIGSGRIVGVVKGQPDDWTITGTTAIEALRFRDYALAKVTGPARLSLHDTQLDLEATLQGAGGRGSGMIAGLAGAAPKLRLELTRFKDGRVLVRALRLAGAGFALTASGTRGLLGRLDFKGRLEVSNLRAVRPGASGAISASWTASQGGGGKPWLFTADARGQRFRANLGELDRLLGAAPHLTTRGTYDGKVFRIAAASLNGAAGHADAFGVIGPRDAMKLAVSWRAQGPFTAGPVEISGGLTGQGLVSGTLMRPKADLMADIGRLDVPNMPLTRAHAIVSFQKIANTYDGLFSLTGDSAYGPARGKAAFRFMPGGLDLSHLDVDAGGVQATGAVSLRGGAPSTAALQINAGPGALLERGTLTGAVNITAVGGAARADIDVQATGAVLRGAPVFLRTARLTASGPLSALPFRLSADGRSGETPFSVTGTGGYSRVGRQQVVNFNGSGLVRRIEARTAEPVTLTIGPDGRSLRARLVVGGGRASLDARDGRSGLTATASLNDIDLRALTDDFAGQIDASFNLNGKGSRLDGLLTAKLQNARTTDAPANTALSGELTARLANDAIAIKTNLTGPEGLTARADVTLPAVASAAPLRIAVARTRPMSGTFAIDGEIRPIWNLYQGGARELSGRVHMVGRLGGTLNDPQVTGDAALNNGRLEDFSTGLVLTNLNADADLRRDSILIRSLSAKDEGSGTVTGSGQISLSRNGPSNLKVSLTRFRLLDNDTIEATASGDTTVVRGADGKARITGALTIDRAEINAAAKLKPSVVSIDVIEINRPVALAEQLPPRKAGAALAALDITLRAPRRVFVKGRGINAEMSMNAHVGGSTSSPQLSGTARVVRGSYDFAGKRFEFEERGRVTLANRASDIALDLQASLQEPTVTAQILIRGSAARPEITLTSTPALPQDEILSQVLFGTSASQLSGAQAAQIASTLTALATGGGFDVLGSLRQFAQLDRLSFGTDTAGATTVAGGRYISDDVYLEIVGGGVRGPQVRVDWRVKRNLSILSELASRGDAKVSVRWRKELRARGGGRGVRSGEPAPER